MNKKESQIRGKGEKGIAPKHRTEKRWGGGGIGGEIHFLLLAPKKGEEVRKIRLRGARGGKENSMLSPKKGGKRRKCGVHKDTWAGKRIVESNREDILY